MKTRPQWLAMFSNARLAGWFILGAAMVAGAEAASYTVVDLGNTYRINGFQKQVLNDKGEVIGSEVGVNGAAALWSSNSWHVLGKLNTSGSGNRATIAHGLNNSSLVVGESDTGTSNASFDQTDAFFVAGTAGTFTGLGLATSINLTAVAYGCNDLGVIVGNVIDDTAGTRETFLYTPTPPTISRVSNDIYSFAINRFGDVLGTAAGLPPQTVLNGVPLPAATAGFKPHAINNSGQILLSADDTHPLPTGWGMIYDYGTGKATALQNLSMTSAGYTTFLDINDTGDVVGRGSDENLKPHAVLYTASTGLTSLDALGLTVGPDAIHLTEAHGINNVGQIVCTGYTTDPNDIHGYLLTPDTAPVLPLAAVYDGLAGSGAKRGVVTITVNKTKFASVKMSAAGVIYSFKVPLDDNGAYNGPPITVKDVPLTVTLVADRGNRVIGGSISDPTTTYQLDAIRQAKLGIFAGKYTALLPLIAPTPALPAGIGHGQMSVSKTGKIKITGQLGDGSKYSASATIHVYGTWTFFAPLYTKSTPSGGLAGFMDFDRTAAESDSSGVLTWSKPGAFSTYVRCQAARYNPGKNQQVLRFATPAGVATFAFAGGEQTLPQHMLLVSDTNAVTVTDPSGNPNSLAVKISAGTGALSGSFVHDVSGDTTKFTGVVQQKLNIAAGVFQGTTTSGSVLLTPQ